MVLKLVKKDCAHNGSGHLLNIMGFSAYMTQWFSVTCDLKYLAIGALTPKSLYLGDTVEAFKLRFCLYKCTL